MNQVLPPRRPFPLPALLTGFAALCAVSTGTLFAQCWLQFDTWCCKISKYAENPTPSGPGGLDCMGLWCPDLPTTNPPVTDIMPGPPGKVDYQVQPRLQCVWNESECISGVCSSGTGPSHSAWCYPYTPVGANCGGGGGGN